MISSQTSRSGPGRQRAGDRDALALAARELAGEARGEARRAGAPARAGRRPRPRAARRDEAAQDARRARDDLVGDAQARVERVVRVLEDDLDPAAGLARAAAREPLERARRRAGCGRADGSCSPATQRAIVVLPEPDSPTSARHSPRRERRTTRRRPRRRRVGPGAVAGAQALDREQPRVRLLAAPRGRAARSTLERRRVPPVEAARARGRGRPRPPAAPRPCRRSSALRAARRERAAGAGARPTPTAMPGMPLQPPRRRVVGDRRDEPARVRVARPPRAPPRPAPPRRCGRRTSPRCGRRCCATTARSWLT